MWKNELSNPFRQSELPVRQSRLLVAPFKLSLVPVAI